MAGGSMSPPTKPNPLLQLVRKSRLSEEEFARLNGWFSERRSRPLANDELLGLYAETVEESLFSDPQTHTPDCMSCGACCAFFHQIPVQLQDATPRSLTWRVTESEDPDELPMDWLRRDKEGHCIAFNGTTGQNAFCSIYELRPRACRAFEAGSDRCHALRRLYGLEPTLPAHAADAHFRVLRDHAANAQLDEVPESSLLQELIGFNLQTLQEIVAELERVKELFDPITGEKEIQLCAEAIRLNTDNRQAILDTLSQGSDEPVDALANHQLLQIGLFSQESVEQAAQQIAEIGEMLYEAMGLDEQLLDR